jgi:hypothetical protein
MFVNVRVRLKCSLKRKFMMADGDLHDQIARLESDIEQLAESLDRCRKAMLFSKVAIAAGVIWILACLFGAIGFEPAIMIGALAAIIGGVVVFGSNWSTSKQTNAAIKAAQMCRAELVDMIDPRAVGANRGWRSSKG